MGNTYGHKVIVPLTNKSGGGVIAGDVVVIDSANNEAFTTNAAGAFTGGVGVAQETIASNATGRVLISGYAPLVNVNASVTRGNFGKTYTVAKQATDAGSSRVAGAFCQFLTAGATPTAVLFGLADATAASATVDTAHGVRAQRASGNVAVGNNTFTVIGFDSETYDTDTMHDNSTNPSRFTVPSISGVTTGLWAVSAHGYTDATAARTDAQVRKNAAGSNAGGTRIGITVGGAIAASGVAPFSLYEECVLSAADYVELFVRTTSGSFNVTQDTDASPIFAMHFLGKVT